MPKMLFQLYIDVRQFEYIKKLSEETGRSRASLVRDMIEHYKKTKNNNNGGGKDDNV
jgi:predicted DNA-binding protein